MVKKLTQVLAFSALLCGPVLCASKAIEITSMKQFNELNKSSKPMITMYTATWCGPCKATKPRFKKLAESTPSVNFCIVDVDKTALKSITSGIKGIPTFKFTRQGKPVRPNVSGGRSLNQLKDLLKDFTAKCPKK